MSPALPQLASKNIADRRDLCSAPKEAAALAYYKEARSTSRRKGRTASNIETARAGLPRNTYNEDVE